MEVASFLMVGFDLKRPPTLGPTPLMAAVSFATPIRSARPNRNSFSSSSHLEHRTANVVGKRAAFSLIFSFHRAATVAAYELIIFIASKTFSAILAQVCCRANRSFIETRGLQWNETAKKAGC
jgi:hypothetical protein